jgi:hypothetical protein
LPNQFKAVARAVIQRIAADNPGHQELTEDDIKVEFVAVFPDASGRQRAQMVSKVLETIESMVPEKTGRALYASSSGERLCLEVFPGIWSHTADQI